MHKSWDFCIMKFFEIHFFRVKEIMKSYRKIVPYSFLFPQICVTSIWITKISITPCFCVLSYIGLKQTRFFLWIERYDLSVSFVFSSTFALLVLFLRPARHEFVKLKWVKLKVILFNLMKQFFYLLSRFVSESQRI